MCVSIVCSMVPIALVPVRTAPVPKKRLAWKLDQPARAALVRMWLDHVIGVIGSCGLEVIVLSPHELDVDAEVWLDQGAGLDQAVNDGISRAGHPAMVVHADLPRLGPEDIDVITGSDADVVIGRSRDGGTNALLVRRKFRARFGRSSALQHAHRARAAGLRAIVLDRPGLALDVDDSAALVKSRVSDA